MYRLTKELPDAEKFGMMPQVRRAALSLTNNIAEGHGRYHYLEQIKFMYQPRGSLQELIDDLNTCLDEKYLPQDRIERLKQEGRRVRQLIDGYIRFLRSRKRDSTTIREEPSASDESTGESTNYESTNYDPAYHE